MRDVVIVPCYERPEFAHICLEYLSRARGIDDKEVWLCQDNHGGKEEMNILTHMFSVADYGHALFSDRFHHVIRDAHGTYGNSKNLIESLQRAYDSGAERIFLVEDDIVVAPDIFSWHEAVLEHTYPFDSFVSCATALSKSANFQINGPQVMDESYQDPNAYLRVIGPYSSHAAAFKRKQLGELLAYIADTPVEWKPGFEQDAYVQKFLRITNQASAWPYMPRALNRGWYSYHIDKATASENDVDPIPEKWPVRLELVKNVQRFS